MLYNFVRSRLAHKLEAWLLVLVGSFLMARSFTIFFVPNGIAPGGVTGIATLIYVATGWPVGLMALILNIPLFILGWRQGGLEFILKTAFATVLVSVFIDYWPGNLALIGQVDDMLLSSLFGGVLLGLGIGLVFRGGSTTGGTDLAASLLHRHMPGLRIAWVLFGIDICVVAACAFVSDPRVALYSLIALFISAKVTDFVQIGLDSSAASYIVTEQGKAITDAIMERLERGVTLLEAKGGYTGKSKDLLFCVTSSREVTQLKRIVASCDPDAFVILTHATEVLGEGFSHDTNPMSSIARQMSKKKELTSANVEVQGGEAAGKDSE